MIARFFSHLRSFDLLLLLSVVFLAAFGLAALYSIGLGKESQDFFFVERQASVFAAALGGAFVLSFFNYRAFRSYAVPFFIISVLLLVSVLVFGSTIRGTRGWFTVFNFGFQPAEFAKIGLILMLARYFSAHTKQVGRFRHILVSGLIALIPIGLVMAQPDFGTGIVVFSIWLGMILMSGIPKRYLAILAGGFVIAGAFFWTFLFQDYQKERIRTFFAPTADVQGSGYNVRQALIAVGSGQLFGQGFGKGSQSHLKFVPENQTDFIFSVIAEEMGLFGVAIVLAFWILFFQRFAAIMRQCRDDFALYILTGIAVMIFVQATIAIGGNLGVLPVTGLPLPFMSYGGSALLASVLAIGIAQSVRIHNT